ncbi:MAG: NlpC/P60 family protein [Cytophagaceae bacterium]|jgi:cell wall-associated NlpC family hydrolase|nr:NlpC/P60 family protein [Cytophagaceae bacterium]
MARYVFLIFICTSFVVTSLKVPSVFQAVFDRMQDATIKARLLQLEKEGVEKTVDTTSYSREKVIQTAESYLGVRHCMGGTTKKGIDCSGLVMVSHKSCGIELPHQSHQQSRYGKVVGHPDSLVRGDMVFFYASYASAYFITHSGIYLGNNQFIHATAQSGVVKSSLIGNSYWGSKFLFGTRIQY